MKIQNGDYEFRRIDDTTMERFIEKEFGGIVYEAFRSLNPALGAMRADFWRYCVLYYYGGVYLDMDSKLILPLKRWVTTTTDALLMLEQIEWDHYRTSCTKVWNHIHRPFPNMTIWASDDGTTSSFLQWLLVFPTAGHSILAETIRLMTDLIVQWYDTDESNSWPTLDRVVCLTGPAVYSIAIMNRWEAVGRNWSRLNANLDRTEGFEKKARFKVGLLQREMNETKKRYTDYINVPIKRTIQPSTGDCDGSSMRQKS